MVCVIMGVFVIRLDCCCLLLWILDMKLICVSLCLIRDGFGVSVLWRKFWVIILGLIENFGFFMSMVFVKCVGVVFVFVVVLILKRIRVLCVRSLVILFF